ncbi:hypothetical protein GLV89_11380 [Halomonas alkaliantarctica]|nr:hypothetical protein [Halomonas alkaliantarctica]
MKFTARMWGVEITVLGLVDYLFCGDIYISLPGIGELAWNTTDLHVEGSQPKSLMPQKAGEQEPVRGSMMELSTTTPDTPIICDKLTVGQLARFIGEFRELRSEIQAKTIHLLLEIAKQPGITISELGMRTGLSRVSCSRSVSLLYRRDRHGKPGLGLVRSDEDPVKPRRNVVRLTKEGQELFARLQTSLDEQGVQLGRLAD